MGKDLREEKGEGLRGERGERGEKHLREEKGDDLRGEKALGGKGGKDRKARRSHGGGP